MEGLLFGLGAVFGVFLWEFLGAMLEKREARIKGVKSTTLSDVKMISLPECDYNEMEDTIEEQKAMINTLKREKQLLINSLLLDNVQKAAEMSRAVSEDLLRKPKDVSPSIYDFVNIDCLASVEDDDVFKHDLFAVKVKQKNGIERIKKITPEEILRSILK